MAAKKGRCSVGGCREECSGNFCPRHWFALPREFRSAIFLAQDREACEEAYLAARRWLEESEVDSGQFTGDSRRRA
jgi:hypothetical protein